MSEFTMGRLMENLESLKMKNTLEILDNYLERAVDELATMRFLENGANVVFLGPPDMGKTHLASALGLVAAQYRFSTYYINCHQLIEQLKKAHFENRLPDKFKVLAKYRMLIIDEIGYL
jgi:DNA replication protein DnaC